MFESLKYGHSLQNLVMSLKKEKKYVNIVTKYGKIIIRIHFKSSQSHSAHHYLDQSLHQSLGICDLTT